MEEDGFKLVRSRRNRRRPESARVHGNAVVTDRRTHRYVADDGVTVADKLRGQRIVENVRRRVEDLRETDYKTAVIPCLEAGFRGLGKSSIKGAVNSIVCYGLGNFGKRDMFSYVSVNQLAVLLCMKDDLLSDERKDRVYLFDPVFTNTEKSVLVNDFGFRMIKENEEGGRKTNGPTCFFMPHCELPLYDNLLAANMGKRLADIILIGNSLWNVAPFDILVREYFAATYKSITKCLDIIDEYPLRFHDKVEKGFSNTSVQTFQRGAELLKQEK